MALSKASSPHESLIAVIDIGSSSVGGALAYVPTHGDLGKATIIATTRTEMTLGDRVNFDRFAKSMYTALDQVLATLREKNKKSVPTVICSLASPWYLSHTRHERIEHDKPFVFSQSLLEKSINEYRARLSKKYDGSEAHTDGDTPPGAGKVTEVQAISIRLNGYETNRPYGVAARRVDLALYASVSQKQMIETVTQKITHELHPRNVSFHSFPLIVFTVLRDLFPDRRDFLLLDVSGEVTDIAMIKQGVVEEIVSFPFGKNFLFRRIGSTLGVPPLQAVGLFSLYRQGKAEREVAKKIEEILAQAGADWTNEFSKGLQSFTSGIALPHHVFFTADSDVGQWFLECIEKEAWGQFTIADREFSVRMIDQAVLNPIAAYNPRVENDVFLSLAAAFAARIRT